jgi:hypothetical protein
MDRATREAWTSVKDVSKEECYEKYVSKLIEVRSKRPDLEQLLITYPCVIIIIRSSTKSTTKTRRSSLLRLRPPDLTYLHGVMISNLVEILNKPTLFLVRRDERYPFLANFLHPPPARVTPGYVLRHNTQMSLYFAKEMLSRYYIPTPGCNLCRKRKSMRTHFHIHPHWCALYPALRI